ncbi:hypothetical protein BGW41_004959 [Actinomortierella wolfii]|nr:hypothetical protein BGW41_004959 [Actinomortierella wolfii]
MDTLKVYQYNDFRLGKAALLTAFSTFRQRMNLVESSQDDPRLIFLATGSRIRVHHFATLTPTAPPTFTRELVDPRETADPNIDKTINQIRVGHLDQDEVLVVVDDAGDVCVWFTQNLSRDPLLFSVEESAWGIDIHRGRSLIAVSSNAHVATLFHCKADIHYDSSDANDHSPVASSSRNQNVHNNDSDDLRPFTSFQQVLRGHNHNIPSIAFSPCGNFLASASVDRTCRMWRLADGQEIAKAPLGPLWGWAVRFVPDQSWIHMTLDQFRDLPKRHLWPETQPGIDVKRFPGHDGGSGSGNGSGNVPGSRGRDGRGNRGRDGRGANSAAATSEYFRQLFPPGMERLFQRTAGTRWYAGPLEGESDLGVDGMDGGSGSGSGGTSAERHLHQRRRQRLWQSRSATDEYGTVISESEGDLEDDIDFYLNQMDQIMQVQVETETEDDPQAAGDDVGGEMESRGPSELHAVGEHGRAGTGAEAEAEAGGREVSLEAVGRKTVRSADHSTSTGQSSSAGDQDITKPFTSASVQTQTSSHKEKQTQDEGSGKRHTQPRPRQAGSMSSDLSNIRIILPSKERHRRRHRRGHHRRDECMEHVNRIRTHSSHTKAKTSTTTPSLSSPSSRDKGKARKTNKTSERVATKGKHVQRTIHQSRSNGHGRVRYIRRHRRDQSRRYPSELLLCATARNIYLERCGVFDPSEQASDLTRNIPSHQQPPISRVWDEDSDDDVYEDDTDGSHESDGVGEGEDGDEDEQIENFFMPWDTYQGAESYDEDDEDSMNSATWEAALDQMFPSDSEDDNEEGMDDFLDALDHDNGQDDGQNAALTLDLQEGGRSIVTTENQRGDAQEAEEGGERQGMNQRSQTSVAAASSSVERAHLKRPRSAPDGDNHGDRPQEDAPPAHRPRRLSAAEMTGENDNSSSDQEEDDDSSSYYDDDVDVDDDVGKNDKDKEPVSLYPISVARSAASRVDGRQIGQLERFDRLIVMRVVPELGIAIAASQKGTVVVLRLLR